MTTRSNVGPPRGIITRDAGTAGLDDRFDHLRRAPSPALAEHVAHLWMVRWRLAGVGPVTVETLPHPCVHVTVEDTRALVGGIERGKFSRRLSGDGRVFGIKLRPAAFQPIAGGSMARFTDRRVSIGRVFGKDGERYARALRAETNDDNCVALAEAFMLARLRPLDDTARLVRDVVERLAVDRELLRVEQVAELMRMDLRRVQRLFRYYLGVSPKWVIQRYRLHEAAALLKENRDSLVSIAHALGYFDQAHFIRDFKAVVGYVPGQFTGKRT